MTGILSTRALYYSSSRYIQEDQTPVRELCMNDLLQRLQYGIEWIYDTDLWTQMFIR